MSFQPGQRIGDYEVLQTLGAGGMGRVYKVRNLISDRVEAMKVLLPDLESDPGLADRFLREIKVQASLNHPNIAQLFTAVRANNQLLMLMEFVDGVTLEQLAAKGPVPLATALDAIVQVLSALGYAHAHGVIHRDIKPANMMLTAQGVVKLMDFGIARAATEHRLTQTGQTVGSLYYMSPEQIRGAEMDTRADLYSLGVSLYEVVTGQRPFKGDSDYSIMAAHLQQNPAPPIDLDPTLPTELNEIMLLTIAKNPEERFQSAEALRNALLRVQEQVKKGPARIATATMPAFSAPPPAPPQQLPVAAAPPPAVAMPPAPPPPSASRRGLYMAVGSLVTLGVLGLAITQIPKWTRTSAAGTTVPSVPVTTAGTPPSPPATTSGSATPEYSTPPQQPTGTTPSAAPDRHPVRPPQQQQAQSQGAAAPTSAPPVPAPPAQQPQPQQQSAAPSTSQAAPPPNSNAAEIAGLRHELMQLGARASTVRETYARLEKEQAKMGMGLRQDKKTALNLLAYNLDEAETALRNNDSAAARKSLERAQKQLEVLEN